MLGEAWRNVTAGSSRAALWAGLVSVLATTLAVADAGALLALEDRAHDYVRSGGATQILSSDSAVSGEVCDALASVENVVAAGAIRSQGVRLGLAALPSTPVPVSEISPGMVALLDVSVPEPAAGLLLSEDLADQVLSSGATHVTALDGGDVPVQGTYAWPTDGRLQALSFTALALTTPDSPYDECWVTVWPSSTVTADLVSLALVPGSGAGQVSVTQLNTSRGPTSTVRHWCVSVTPAGLLRLPRASACSRA